MLKQGSYFITKPKTVTAISVYIAIVGIVYNVVLRWQWNPVGLQKFVDEVLHVAVPVLFLLFWFLMVPKNNLQWKNAFSWLLFPLFYCIFILLRGASSGFYPYPFMNISLLGINKVLLNSLAVCGAFLLVSFMLIAAAKWITTFVK